MRHRFEDSCNMNILNWKLYQKINSMRTCSSRKVEFVSEITSFLPLKFEHGNYLFPVQRFLCTFYNTAEYGFKFFAKIMKWSWIFCCSSCISFNPTSRLKRFKYLSKICTNRQRFELYLAKLCSRDKHCTTASLIKVPPLKVGVYLILEVHNTLFTDPT